MNTIGNELFLGRNIIETANHALLPDGKPEKRAFAVTVYSSDEKDARKTVFEYATYEAASRGMDRLIQQDWCHWINAHYDTTI